MCATLRTIEVPASEVFEAWQHWAKANAANVGTPTGLGRCLSRAGWKRVKKAGRSYYVGVALRNAEAAAPMKTPRLSVVR